MNSVLLHGTEFVFWHCPFMLQS